MAAFLIGAVVYFHFYDVSPTLMNIWITVNCLSAAGRFFYTGWAVKKISDPSISEEQLVKFEWGYALQLVLFGGLWGAIHLFLQDKIDPQSSQLLLLCYFGILAGGLSTLTASRLCSQTIIATMVGGFTLYQLLSIGSSYYPAMLAVAGLSFWMILAKSAEQAHEMILKSLLLNQEKQKAIEVLSEKLELQEKLKEQEKLNVNQALMAELGQLAGGIAHEINNPLSIIAISNMCIKKATKDLKVPGLEKHTNTIERTLKRISKITDAMLKLSRGKKEENETCRVNTVINDVALISEGKLKRYNVQFQIAYNVSDTEVAGSSTEVSQVILNLINNAIDEIQDQENPWIKIEALDQKDKVHIEVSDSGLGIPDEAREKLFQPFYTSKPVGKGTGLGLSLSSSIMRNIKGRIFLKDTEQTCFVVELSRADNVESGDSDKDSAA